jgi:hypothetical protein
VKQCRRFPKSLCSLQNRSHQKRRFKRLSSYA